MAFNSSTLEVSENFIIEDTPGTGKVTLIDDVINALQMLYWYSGGLHWVASSTFDFNNGEIFFMDSLFHGGLSQHTKH